MYIGKDGEFLDGVSLESEKKKGESSWLLILLPKQNGVLGNIGGLHCTLKNLQSVAAILGENQESIHDKLVALGQEGIPAVLKVGEESELCQIAVALSGSKIVCTCNFALRVVPSCV